MSNALAYFVRSALEWPTIYSGRHSHHLVDEGEEAPKRLLIRRQNIESASWKQLIVDYLLSTALSCLEKFDTRWKLKSAMR
jgi:hypothetical protein